MLKPTKKKKKRTSHKEISEHLALAKFLDRYEGTAGYWFHPPNGGWRGNTTARWLRRMGAKSGVPDIMICRPVTYRGEYYIGLAIELKRTDGTYKEVSANQRHWLNTLSRVGWLATWCCGAEDAVKLIKTALPERMPLPLPWVRYRERRALAVRLLRDPIHSQMSDRAVARWCGIASSGRIADIRAMTPVKGEVEPVNEHNIDDLIARITQRHMLDK